MKRGDAEQSPASANSVAMIIELKFSLKSRKLAPLNPEPRIRRKPSTAAAVSERRWKRRGKRRVWAARAARPGTRSRPRAGHASSGSPSQALQRARETLAGPTLAAESQDRWPHL